MTDRKDEKVARLAEALRANLRKRKAVREGVDGDKILNNKEKNQE